MEIHIGEKYGCLEILDEGTEFLDLIDAKIERINEEKTDFINAINNGEIEHDDWHGWNGKETVITPAFVYTPKNFVVKYHTSIRKKEFGVNWKTKFQLPCTSVYYYLVIYIVRRMF